MFELQRNSETTQFPENAGILLIPEQPSPGHDLLEASNHSEITIDYALMSDNLALDALRQRLEMLGTEGDNAIDLIAELKSNYVQNVQPEDRHLVVGFLNDGTLRITYLGLGDIRQESYDFVQEKLLHPTLSDLMEESGRGYFIMHQLSTDRGINRLTNQAGERIGVELWFDVRPDDNIPTAVDF